MGIWMTRHSLSKTAVQKALKEMSREPFKDVLAELLGSRPTKKSLKEFADAHPDRWAQAVTLFARMGGFSDKTVVEYNFYHHILQAPDSELLILRDKLSRELDYIEGDFQAVPALPEEGSDNDSTSTDGVRVTESDPSV